MERDSDHCASSAIQLMAAVRLHVATALFQVHVQLCFTRCDFFPAGTVVTVLLVTADTE